MVVDVGEEFLLLQLGDAAQKDFEYRTRTIGSGMFVALDHAKRRVLLLPVEDGLSFAEDLTSQGVHLLDVRLMINQKPRRHAALVCVDAALELVFERLVNDVVSRVQVENSSPLDACRRALDDWRMLLRRASRMSLPTLLGLLGELEILRQIGTSDPYGAMRAWVGWDGAINDFQFGGKFLEVKATLSREGNHVVVNGIDQLDPAGHERLDLVVVRLHPAEDAPSLDERVEALINDGFPRHELLERLERLGYIPGTARQETRYAIETIQSWHVNDAFPGLRRSKLHPGASEGISAVHYTLSLDHLPAAMDSSSLETSLKDWLRA